MRVLVCGGRDYRNHAYVFGVLDEMHAATPITCIIQGGARGADLHAYLWARERQIPNEQYDADWESDGLAAGPIRNARMLRDGKPDLVVAFPGGRGTADMVRQARAAGVSVREVTA